MIAKHVDLFAIGAMLLGIFIYTQVQKPALVRALTQRRPLTIKRLVIRPPQPPVTLIAFMK